MNWNRRKLYPKEWQVIASARKAACGWQCERCGIHHGSKRISKRTGELYRVWLHAAHVTFDDTLNPSPDLLCLCPTCHGRYDFRLRRRLRRVEIERLKHQRARARQEKRVC